MKGYIKQRGKDSWSVVVCLGRQPNGKYKYKWITVHGGKKQAEAKLAEVLHQLNLGQPIESSKVTLGEYLDRWLMEGVQPSVREKTYRFYRQIVEDHLKPRLGHIPLQKLTPLDLQGYYRSLLARGRLDASGQPTGEALSSATVRAHHRTIHRALTQAMRWGLVTRNVADAVEPPKVEKKEFTVITPDQANALLEAARSTGRYVLYLTALLTGMREGEILGLRWQDTDLDKGQITVRQILHRGGRSPSFGPPKTDRGARSIAMSPELVQALREYRKHQAEWRLAMGPAWRDYDLVFTTSDGGPISPRNLVRQFKSLLHRAGLPPTIRFHDLRHTHASWLLAKGVHPKVVQERLGHSSIAVTMDIYSHVAPTLQQQAANLATDTLFQYGDAKKSQAF